MDRQDSWKKTEDVEIDLIDLLQRLCRQWKRIAICAFVFAVVTGGYGYMKARNDLDMSVVTEDAGLALEEAGKLTKAEEQAVADAVRMKQEIRELELYLNHSILMQLDPYHKTRIIMLYKIDRAQRQELPGILESYLNFVQNGGAADALTESGSWQLDKSYLAELVSVYQKTYSFPYQIAVDSTSESMYSDALFYVEITGLDAEAAKKTALDMQRVTKDYSSKVEKRTGSHRLKLISSVESVTVDAGLQIQQHDKKALLSSNKTNLKVMIDAFSKEQMAVYLEAVDEEGSEWEEETGTVLPVENVSGETEADSFAVVKYILIGFLTGIFIYGAIFCCWYIFYDLVKSVEEMRRLYTFPVFGGILPTDSEERSRKVLPEMYQDAYGHTKVQVLNRVRLACQKQKIVKICAVSDFLLDVLEREYLENMARQLKALGIEMSIAESVNADTDLWDHLVKTGSILMVCRMGTTRHRMIDDAMNFYLENGIDIAGAVLFLQNG